MSSSAAASGTAEETKTLVNDFSVEIATVNGSGSQTANSVLMRTIFQMGVPVSGKNLFPSNIAGLPTWFQIRANAKGYVARKHDIDLMICMNPETAKEDVAKLPSGALVIYDEPLKLNELRQDLVFYPVPFQKLVTASCPEPKLHKLVKNMIYVGVAGQSLGLDMEEVKKAISKQLNGKAKAIEINQAAVQAGFEWSAANMPAQTRLKIVRDDKTKGQIIIDGNAACALGAMFAGVQVLAWYPITPASSLSESLIDYADEYRKDPATGKSTFAHVQMEDELASAGAVLGAGWAGARSMTTTSGPGISLMSEMIGLGYFTEIPGVFFNVARTGPSTGLPTRTMQGDVEICAKCSHGDTFHINLYPGNMQECFDFAYMSFDLAERFQTPIFVVTDLDLGMQNWASQPFKYPEGKFDRGKVLGQKELEEIKDWGRYKDVDGDGIPYRTLPGTPGGKGAYFTRGSGHNPMAQYSEKPEDYKQLVDRLRAKYDTAKAWVPKPIVEDTGSKRGILAFGSSDPAVKEARDRMKAEAGMDTSYLRLRALPFTAEVDAFLTSMDAIYVVEQNRDAQMLALLREFYPQFAMKFKSVLHYNGQALDAQTILDQITAFEK
ncbi:MAG: 2-oxoacid:acceptor oxidoreductase subunit alpha [Holophagaceae bacterium]|nr:2-oxoacid:acceptor oxidoreductase subunit alpha [Holophagaceae bacterium]